MLGGTWPKNRSVLGMIEEHETGDPDATTREILDSYPFERAVGEAFYDLVRAEVVRHTVTEVAA